MKPKRYLIFLVIFAIFFAFHGIKPVDAIIKPKIQLVVQPNLAYKSSNTIYLTVKSPNYKGKVQYRAILYDINTNS